MYFDEEDTYEYNLSASTSIIYNGVSIDKPLDDILNPNGTLSNPADSFRGKIILIDNDDNGVIDCVV